MKNRRVMLDEVIIFFFKQKTAYEMRISDWSSDVCSSDLLRRRRLLPEGAVLRRPGLRAEVPPGGRRGRGGNAGGPHLRRPGGRQIGRASCRERVCQYV